MPVASAAASALIEKPAGPLPRDKRVDQIGFVGEVDKLHANLLKTKVKLDMLERANERVTGDFFEGLLVQGTTATVDPAKFYRLFEKGEMTKAQFLSAISVKKDAAAEFLSRGDLSDISTEKPSTPSLRVTRIKTVELTLTTALQSIELPA